MALTGSATISGHPDLCSLRGRDAQVSAEAVRILDDIRRAISWSPELATAAALELVGVLAQPAKSKSTRGGVAPWQMRKIDRYLGEHLKEPLHTEELASLVSLSASHLCRTFKQSDGTTPHAHIITLRLRLAQLLMLTTTYPLNQIALECGMADQSHLSRLFRREAGQSPDAWRRQHVRNAKAAA